MAGYTGITVAALGQRARPKSDGVVRIMRSLFLVLLILVLFSAYAFASPCDGIRRDLRPWDKEVLMLEIGKQVHRPVTGILDAFRFRGWSIIYVSVYQADEAFIFYAHDPLSSYYITSWSGAARRDEEKEIMSWVIKNAPGIPKKLAACFARHVTKGRDL